MAQGHNQNKDRGGYNTGNNPSSTSSTGTSTGTTFAESAKETAGGFAETAKSFGETAKSAASNVAQRAGDAASYVGKSVQGAAGSVAGSMKSLGETIRENVPQEGYLGTAGSAVADTLESSGRYLEEHGLSGIGEDMTNLIRRNPIPALLVGIGIGFLIARATRS